MKSKNLLRLCSLLALFSACGNGTPKYDATGTFETTEVLVSAEASGKLLYFNIEEGTVSSSGSWCGGHCATLSEKAATGSQHQIR